MQPSVIVWDLETVPDLGGFAAASGGKKLDDFLIDKSARKGRKKHRSKR